MLIIMICTCKRYLIALNTYWHFRAKAIISEKHETVRYGTGHKINMQTEKKKKKDISSSMNITCAAGQNTQASSKCDSMGGHNRIAPLEPSAGN